MTPVYLPAEDSFFLCKFVEKEILKNKPEKILDMGSGSGIQAEVAIKSGANPKCITLIDKNPEAIRHLKNNFPESNVLNSDLFNKIKGGKFNLIIFNPPYLPKSKFDSGIDTTGGKNGSEIINKFLEQAKSHLEKGGKILLLTSSLTKNIEWSGYKKKLLGKKNLFFEKLYVWGLKVNN